MTGYELGDGRHLPWPATPFFAVRLDSYLRLSFGASLGSF